MNPQQVNIDFNRNPVYAGGATLTPAGKEKIGFVRDMRDLPGGGMLIRADEGWFRYDPTTRLVAPAGKEKTGFVRDMRDLPGGGMLIRADEGWFRYDPTTRLVASAGGQGKDRHAALPPTVQRIAGSWRRLPASFIRFPGD